VDYHSTGEDRHKTQKKEMLFDIRHLYDRGRMLFIAQHPEYTGRASVVKEAEKRSGPGHLSRWVNPCAMAAGGGMGKGGSGRLFTTLRDGAPASHSLRGCRKTATVSISGW
jgi:hypothetical protein